jgi:Prokaryotic RING finger family 4
MLDQISELILRRRQAILVETNNSTRLDDDIIITLEAQLVELGYIMSKELRDKICYLTKNEIKDLHDKLFEDLGELLGFNRPHTPLFKNFPDDIPDNIDELLIDKTIAYYLQDDSQVSVLSGKIGKCHLLSCGHYVHEADWDGSEYNACPICGRNVNLNNDFFKEAKQRSIWIPKTKKLKILNLAKTNEVENIFLSIINSSIPVSPEDMEDLELLTSTYINDVIDWLPEKITLKENIAKVFGMLLKLHSNKELIFETSKNYLKTSTDVLRFIVELSDGDISLSTKTEFNNIPRTNRKGILSILDSIYLNSLVEDMLRNEGDWKRIGEILHPFEYVSKYPTISTAFAVIRGLKLNNDKVSKAITNVVKRNKDICIDNNEVIFETYSSKLQKSIDDKEYDKLVDLLSERPGELSRRIDQVLRLSDKTEHEEKVVDVICKNLHKMTSPILLNLSSYLNARTSILETRIFFPKGDISKAWYMDDEREPLSVEIAAPIIFSIEEELVKRSEINLKKSIIDERLEDLVVPFSERSVSKSLVRLPRGSKLPLPDSNKLRLFLHWMEDDNNQTIDLDLSTAFYDYDWKHVGQCDYTELQFGNNAAKHSGDYTSAPKPNGASEFIDLDIQKLLEKGVRYVSYVVFSYNAIPFDQMSMAFSGWMPLDNDKGKVFEPRKIEQKFDLDGDSKIIVPMIIDLETKEMYWVDINQRSDSGYNSVHRFKSQIGKMGKSLLTYFDSKTRPSLYQLAAIHASKTDEVILRKKDDKMVKLNKEENETDFDFYQRILSKSGETYEFEETEDEETENPPILAITYKDDFKIPEKSISYSLYRENDTSNIETLNASDLISKLN